MFLKGFKLTIILSLTILVAACGLGTGGEDGSSTGTSRISISLGRRLTRGSETLYNNTAGSVLPEDIDKAIAICSGSDMSPVIGTLPLDGTRLVMKVPSGPDRAVSINAYAGDILRMTGSSAISYLYPDITKTVTITLRDIASEEVPVFSEAVYWGDTGNQYGYGIDIYDGKIYLSGVGIMLQYNIPPGNSGPVWKATWGGNFYDVAVSEAGVFGAGLSSTFSQDPVGDKEYKSAIARFLPPDTGPDWYDCPIVHSYSGYEGFRAAIVVDDFVYTTGYAQQNGGNRQATLLKYDKDGGSPIWTRFFTGTGYYSSHGEGLVWSNGYLYASGFDGEGSTKAVLSQYDTEGNQNPLWKTNRTYQPYGGIAEGYGVASDISGNLYQVGNMEVSGNKDILFLKYDENGTLLWNKQWGGPAEDKGWAVACSESKVYIVGQTASFGEGGIDVVLLQVDPADGTVLTEEYWGGPADDIGWDLALTDTDIYIVGQTASFGEGGSDIFLLRYGLPGKTTAPGLIVTLDPPSLTMKPFETQPFTAVIQNTTNGNVDWYVNGLKGGDSTIGTIDAYGVYTAPAGVPDPSTVTIMAISSSDLNANGTAQVTIETPAHGWARTYGGAYYDNIGYMQQTFDGGFIVLGHTQSFGMGGNDVWVMKLDSEGAIEWQKTYGGPSDDNRFTEVRQTSDGGYIITGQTQSFGAGFYDGWILKLDPDGSIEWQKTYGGPQWEWLSCIKQTEDGGYIAAGDGDSFGIGSSYRTEFLVFKLNPDGSTVWQKAYGGGTMGEERPSDVIQTTDGGYVVAGRTDSFGQGSNDVWILKLDPDGSVVWQKTYGGSKYDEAIAIQQTSDGGYIVTGATESFGAGDSDIWVLKLDANGTVAWQKTYGGTEYERGKYIGQTPDGGYILTGRTESFGAGEIDVWVLKLNTDGSIEWQKTYGGALDENPETICQMPDGGYAVVGSTVSFGAGHLDIWIIKMNNEGNLGCGLDSDTAVIPEDTTVAGIDTVISGVNYPAVISNTNVAGFDTSSMIHTQCSAEPAADSDSDGLSDIQESALGTDPMDPDSDDDGLSDGEEVNTHSTNPLEPDTDNDALSDGDEVNTYATNPSEYDTDGDNFDDGTEVTKGTDPLDPYDFPARFGPGSEISTLSADTIFVADVDNDGDVDVLSASWYVHTVAWHENIGNGSSWTTHTISNTVTNARCVYAADVDGDGDMDVLSASWGEHTVAWHENTTGDGSGWTNHIITTSANRVRGVYATDIDGDGDMDVLSASTNDNKVAWYENTAVNGSAWTSHIITNALIGPYCIWAADVDGDNHMDVIAGSNDNDTTRSVAWFENTNGDGSSWTTYFLPALSGATADYVERIYVEDMDGDGDIDVLSASWEDDKIIWYENKTGDGKSWTAYTITNTAYGAYGVWAADLDNDGDMDVLSASEENDTFAWYENMDGNGTFGAKLTISSTANEPSCINAADIDGDNNMDVVGAFNSYIMWYKNKGE